MVVENSPSEDKNAGESEFTWDVPSELALFQALIYNKPAGINKHFSMALVTEKLSSQLGPSITSEVIWAKLRTMFDLAAVDDWEEVIPFPLEEKVFCFPRKEYGGLIADKQKEILSDKVMGRSNKGGVARVATDMGSEGLRKNSANKDKVETPKANKSSDQKAEELAKSSTKRHSTRSTPLALPSKKKK